MEKGFITSGQVVMDGTDAATVAYGANAQLYGAETP